MGGCLSSNKDPYEGGAQGGAGSGHSHKHHKSTHGNSAGGGKAEKKIPTFGLGEAFEVCVLVCMHSSSRRSEIMGGMHHHDIFMLAPYVIVAQHTHSPAGDSPAGHWWRGRDLAVHRQQE